MSIEENNVSIWQPSGIISTVLSIGRIPFAPGTWGSLFGVLIFPAFLIIPIRIASLTHEKISAVILVTLSALLLMYLIGVIAIRKYQSMTQTQDSSEIVYDELFGQILTFCLIAAFYIYWNMHVVSFKHHKISLAHSLVYQFVPFIWFRLFDIVKVWPIRVIDSKCKNAHGVMLDDVLAGVFAAIASVPVFMIIDTYFRF